MQSRHVTRTVALTAALGVASSTLAQVPREKWVGEVGGPEQEIGLNIAVDRDDEVVLLATSEQDSGVADILLTRFDRTGRTLWSVTWDGGNGLDDRAYGLLLDDDGNAYVSGWTTTTDRGTDFLLLKYAPDGTLLWTRTYAGAASSNDFTFTFRSIAFGPDGNIHLAGSARAADNVTEFGVVKYAPNGDLVWDRTWRSPEPTRPTAFGWALVVDDAGVVSVSGDATPLGGRDTDFALVRWSSDGALLSETFFDGTPGLGDSVYDMAIDAAGNVLLTGISDTGTGFEYCTVKFDDQGVAQWEGRYGGTTGFHYGWLVTTDPDGNAYVTGLSHSIGGEYDIATVKYEPDGTQAWTRRYTEPLYFGDDIPYDIEVGPDGHVYVVGNTWRWFTDGTDAIVLEYDPAGTLLSTTLYGGEDNGGNDGAFALAIDPDDLDLHVAGISARSGDGPDAVAIAYGRGPAPTLEVTPLPLQAGSAGTFVAVDLEPETATYLAYSLVGPGETFVPLLQVTLGLLQPIQAGPIVTSDADGAATWTLPIPGGAAGTPVWFQAAQYHAATDVVATTVE